MKPQLTLDLVVPQHRRAFIRDENTRLERLLDVPPPLLVGWRRSYRCDCGFATGSPGAIFDHAGQHGAAS